MSRDEVKIKEIKNGFVVTTHEYLRTEERCFTTLEECFAWIKLYYE